MSYDARSALGWITAIGVVAAVLSYISSLLVSAASTVTGQFAPQFSSLALSPLLWAFMIGFEGPPANAALTIIGCLIVFAICFGKAAKSDGGFLAGLRQLSTGSRPKKLPNWLIVMPLVGSALLVIDLLLSLIQASFGVSTGSLGITDPSVLVARLALAPIAEEIGFRMSPLWLFLTMLIAYEIGKRISAGLKMSIRGQVGIVFYAFISPGCAKERAGLPSIRTSGVKGVSALEWIGLAFTATIFGLIHVFSGSGWGPGKFLTAALSGFVLGIVYLAYGAYANILLHWFFDVYLTSFAYNGISGTLTFFGDLATLGVLALGVWGIIVGLYWLSGPKSGPVVPTMWQVA